MSLLYPRTITITRSTPNNAVGVQGYSGVTETSETTVFAGLSAAIQFNREKGVGEAGLPGDVYNRTGFLILIPAASAALGSITERDIVTDDIGKRYQVTAAIWTLFGYSLHTVLLEA